MKNFFVPFFITATVLAAADSSRPANTVVLDAVGVKNLRIETAVAEEADFEETAFALGRLEVKPGQIAAVSSRISGRIVKLSALPGDRLSAGDIVAQIESRQPSNPAPIISLTAPLSGIITALDVRLGDPVEPDKALLEITDLGELQAVARVPEHIVGKLQPGAMARLKIAAVPNAHFEAKLLRFGTAADAATGTLDAIFALPNPTGQLRPGLRAEFSIVLSRRADVMRIPRSALYGDAINRHVYVKDFDLPNAFLKTPVVVGQLNETHAEIISGLMPADEVVTTGGYTLAFAGGGSISLKEALDAAHGHEHAADGSELTDADRAKKKTTGGDAHDHGHDEHEEHGGSLLWQIISAALFTALLVVTFIMRPERGMKK